MSTRKAIVAALLLLGGCAQPRDFSALMPLSDDEFWHLATMLSEPAGTFDLSDNLVSNERQYAQLAGRIRVRGGVYIGVGPEQNFSYIAHIQPALAFIVDIRPENRHLHLMYKALFELAADRSDFVARLFSRERPAGLGADPSVDELFDILAWQPPLSRMRDDTRQRIRALLTDMQGFPLTPEDLASIDATLEAFFVEGPAIRYGRSLPSRETQPTYRALMTVRDVSGVPRSFLASDELFAYVKELQRRNLVVPVVGDFAGPVSIREIGAAARQRGLKVSAFYGSNVEVHLNRDQRRTFCRSVETLPWDAETVFIASDEIHTLEAKLAACGNIPPSLHWP